MDKSANKKDWLSELEGQIERITYTNEETGYTVARVNVKGYPAPVTIMGKQDIRIEHSKGGISEEPESPFKGGSPCPG